MILKTRQDISHTKMKTTIKKKLLPLSFIALVTISLTVPYQTAISASDADLFLHGIGSNANPQTLFLDGNSPTSTTAKFRDSGSVNFAGGNQWKEIGNWTNTPGSGTLTSLSDFQVWLGLKNSDDIGTKFDLRADIYKNNQLVVSGQTLCMTGITRNPDQAKDTMVSFGTFAPVSFGSTDLLSLKVLTRIGTNPDNTQCGGHFNAVGLRAYFDSVNRPAKFDMTFVSTSVVIFQDDYSSSAGWTQIGSSVTVNSPSHPGVAYFDNAADGGGVDDNRIFKQLPSTLPSIWTGDFDYKFTTSSIPAAYAWALTASNANPEQQGSTGSAILVYHGPEVDQLHIRTWEGLTVADSTAVPISANTDYYVRLEKTPTQLILMAFSDPARTIQIPGSPVTLAIAAPTDFNNLNLIQHSTSLSSGSARTLTAQVDNTKIFTP